MDGVKTIAQIYLGLHLLLLVLLLCKFNAYKFFFAIIYRLPCFVAKKILIAVPWIISAAGAVTVGFVALGRQFFNEGNAKIFVERFLPPRDFSRKTFSLAMIELMLVFHAEILSTAKKIGDGIKLLRAIINSDTDKRND